MPTSNVRVGGAGGGGGTPSRTGTPSQVDASGGDGSTSVTVPAGANGVVAFWSHWDGNGGSNISALTLNGVGFTVHSQLNEGATADENGVGVATLASPATGSQTLAWTWSAGGARTEGGAIILVYYENCNTADMFRAADTDAETVANAAIASLASTDTTDRVVGMYQTFDNSDPIINGGVTAFIDSVTFNRHIYDVGDATGLTGTVNISSTQHSYSSAAAISLKAS